MDIISDVVAPFLQAILMLILIVVIVLVRKSVSSTKNKNGRRVAYYGTNAKVLAFVTLIFGLGVVFIIFDVAGENKLISTFIVSVSILPLILLIFLEIYLGRIEFDAKGIYTYSPLRKNQNVKWEDIIDCEYHNEEDIGGIGCHYLLKTKLQGDIKLSTVLSGLEGFFNEFSKRNKLIGEKFKGVDIYNPNPEDS